MNFNEFKVYKPNVVFHNAVKKKKKKILMNDRKIV